MPDRVQGRRFYVFEHTDECHDPLVSAAERFYSSDRCTDPDILLALLECVAAIPCPSYQEYRHRAENGSQLCAPEHAATGAASCDPF